MKKFLVLIKNMVDDGKIWLHMGFELWKPKLLRASLAPYQQVH